MEEVEITNWIETLAKADGLAAREVLSRLNDLMYSDQLDEIDRIAQTFSSKELPTRLQLAFLTGTLPVRSKLKYRRLVLVTTIRLLCQQYPDAEVAQILRGLQ